MRKNREKKKVLGTEGAREWGENGRSGAEGEKKMGKDRTQIGMQM